MAGHGTVASSDSPSTQGTYKSATPAHTPIPAGIYGSVRALFCQEWADLKARTPFPSIHPDPAVPSPIPTPEFLPFFLAFWKQLGVGLPPHNPASDPGRGCECLLSPHSSGLSPLCLKFPRVSPGSMINSKQVYQVTRLLWVCSVSTLPQAWDTVHQIWISLLSWGHLLHRHSDLK